MTLLGAQTKAGVRVDFVWQLGKKSAIGKIVDKVAKAAARRGGLDIDGGYRPGTVCRSLVKGGVAQPYPAKGQLEVIRAYAKKLMFRGENRISFNIFGESTQTFEAKFYAFAMLAIAAQLHRWHGYRVKFNDDPNYPQILEHIEEVVLPKPAAKRRTAQT